MAADGKQEKAPSPLDIEKLAAVLDQLPAGVMVAEAPSGRVLYANKQAAQIFGGPVTATERAENYDADFHAWDAEGKPLPSDEFPLVKALSGELVEGQVVVFQRPDGTLRTVRASAAPVRDAGGTVVAAVTAYYDVTAAKRVEDELAFLAAASDLLASSLDLPTTLERVAALPVPERADWCFVDLLEPDGGFVRVAIGSHAPEDAELVERLRRRYPPRPGVKHGVARALRGEHHISGTVDEAMLRELARDDEHLALLHQLHMRSFLSVPLYARGRPIGALTLASRTRNYDDGDLRSAVELGRRAAAAIESARLYAETEARAAEQARWERLFRHSGWGVALITPDFVLREVNAAWAAMHGFTVAELQGRPLATLLAPSEREAMLERGRRIDDGEHLQFESLHVRKDGSSFPVLIDVISVRDDAGRVQYRAANCQDISDRKRTDEAMRTSEARLHAFIDSSSSVFYLKDLEGRHILVNREFERMTGKKREELLGKTDYDIVDRATAEAFRADDRKVLATALPVQIAHSFVFNGHRRSFLTTKFPVRDVRGQVYGVGGISTDVTDQHRLEAELRASERRFRTLAQATTDIVWTIDRSGRGFRDSVGWRAFTGQSEAMAASDRASEAVHPEDAPRVREIWQAAIVEKRPFAMEYRLRRHDGVYVPMAVRAAPVIDDDGRVLEWVGTCTDISGAKKL
ncbi:MAG: sensor protein, partial [bacterium]|nr:sensor protein [bacterium]